MRVDQPFPSIKGRSWWPIRHTDRFWWAFQTPAICVDGANWTATWNSQPRPYDLHCAQIIGSDDLDNDCAKSWVLQVLLAQSFAMQIIATPRITCWQKRAKPAVPVRCMRLLGVASCVVCMNYRFDSSTFSKGKSSVSPFFLRAWSTMCMNFCNPIYFYIRFWFNRFVRSV